MTSKKKSVALKARISLTLAGLTMACLSATAAPSFALEPSASTAALLRDIAGIDALGIAWLDAAAKPDAPRSVTVGTRALYAQLAGFEAVGLLPETPANTRAATAEERASTNALLANLAAPDGLGLPSTLTSALPPLQPVLPPVQHAERKPAARGAVDTAATR